MFRDYIYLGGRIVKDIEIAKYPVNTYDKTIHSTKGSRVEVLWTNYDPRPQQELFA